MILAKIVEQGIVQRVDHSLEVHASESRTILVDPI